MTDAELRLAIETWKTANADLLRLIEAIMAEHQGPCAQRHVFVWIGNDTTETQPPVGTRCACGGSTWR